MSTWRSYKLWAVPLVAGVLAFGALPAVTGSAGAATPGSVRDDFDGDGYQDLAVGAPNATVSGKQEAGHVVVMYGGKHGLDKTRRTVISRATTGIPGAAATGEGFGVQLSKGDLDGDGRTDLIVGHTSSVRDAVVVWGGRRGLSGGVSVPAAITRAGDFDGDGKQDLALFRTGRSQVDDPYGTTATVWTGPLSRSGRPAAAKAFGSDDFRYYDVLDAAAGDVNGDGRDDLALTYYIGDGGYGSAFYLASASGSASGGVFTSAAAPEGTGEAAFGDVNDDGYDDLVRGDEDRSTITVALGSAAGLSPEATWKTYSQNTPGVPGGKESVDLFGASVSAGDINGDGYDDVAVGAPGEELGYDDGAGVVDVLYGGPGGLTGKGAQGFSQDTAGVPGAVESGDDFGAAVRLLDINGNGYADLAVSAAHENSGDGAVWSLRGRPAGIVTDAAFAFGGKTVGAPYAKAAFGYAVN
ncbi:FG-GAP-like repeat-containing protein [Streptomyces sp. S.PB5]|uniref:FG-GAP-like repeat-containing protein n=1 Tax=Streptomyces sp. S.PB5 TaxID=3020844 RepID=UPI0025B1AFDB|nr:FG-GAP-like repeat-containing protein [Streptomyces sp. S.PB5]MDN3024595.1 FG-GAP-like repeat-containing protein [Streptomyces sp. S.PB5]